MIQSPSDNLRAVVILHNAKRYTLEKFDGSFWILDFRMWELVPLLKGAEHQFAIQLIASRSWPR